MTLATRSARGAAWGVAAGLASRIVGLGATLFLTRCVGPADYGEVSIAMIVVITLNQIFMLGVGVYLTAHPDAGREVTFHATVVHVGLGVPPLIIAFLFANPLGVVAGGPEAGRYVPLLALAYFIDRCGSIPERLLLRKLRFRRSSATRGAGELAYAVVTVGAAIAGAGVMAMVLGNVARSLLRGLAFTTSVHPREWLAPAKLSFRTFAMLVRHGVWVSVAGFFDVASRKWDSVVMGKLFGPGIAGTYNLAYNLAEIPALQVGEPITNVLQISYAHADDRRRGDSLRRSLGILSLLLAPLSLGLAAVSDSLTRAFFPASWAGLGPFLFILPMVSVARPLDGAIVAYLQARSQPRLVAIVDGFGVLLLLVSMWTVGRIGPSVACATVIGSFVVRAAIYFWMLRIRGVSAAGPLMGAVLRPLLAATVMALGVRLIERYVGSSLMSGVALAFEIAAGALLYVLAAFVVSRREAVEFIDVARRALRR